MSTYDTDYFLVRKVDVDRTVEALEEATALVGPSQAAMNTDQGFWSTSQTYTGTLRKHGIRISMGHSIENYGIFFYIKIQFPP